MKKILSILAFAVIILPVFAFAQNRAAIDVSIPCISCKYANDASPVGLIANFYEMAIALSGVLALGMIIYAGIKRIIGANNPKEVSESNDIIYNALLGIVLLFGAYILLNTINPQLTKLELPVLTKIEERVSEGILESSYKCTGNDGVRVASCHQSMEECAKDCIGGETRCTKTDFCAPSGLGACPVADFLPITDPLALRMENGETILWSSGNPSIDANLNKLRVEFNKLKAKVPSARETSVYRPKAYQDHLYQIYSIHQALKSLTPAQRADCKTVEDNLKRESAKHGICAPDSPCKVGRTSLHSAGNAIDISVSGITYKAISDNLGAWGIKLKWFGNGDEVHFSLQ